MVATLTAYRTGMKALRYEAVLYASQGRDTVSLFRELPAACQWVLRHYAGHYRPGNAAAAVYDLHSNGELIFATKDPNGFISREKHAACGEGAA
jgi:hypothetical protein